jgi:hypothetical protein
MLITVLLSALITVDSDRTHFILFFNELEFISKCNLGKHTNSWKFMCRTHNNGIEKQLTSLTFNRILSCLEGRHVCLFYSKMLITKKIIAFVTS